MENNQEWPSVIVIIPTFNRKAILTQTINLLQKNLKYSGPWRVLVGEDSTDPEEYFGANLLEKSPVPISIHRHDHNLGLGANLNWLLKANPRNDFVLQMDDDHWLVQPLDITPHVKKLMEDETAGCIRLMGIGGHSYTATLGRDLYWRISWESAEVYIASNRPHLKSISRFHGQYGFYPEGEKLGVTEEMFCHNCIDRAKLNLIQGMRTVDVLIPLDVPTETGWQHNEHHGAISWQARGF